MAVAARTASLCRRSTIHAAVTTSSTSPRSVGISTARATCAALRTARRRISPSRPCPAGTSHEPTCPTSRSACRKPSSVRTSLALLTARSLTQRRDRSRHEQEAPIAAPAAGRGRRRVTARSQLHHERTRPSPCEVPGRGDGRHAPGHVHSDTLHLLISREFGRRGRRKGVQPVPSPRPSTPGSGSGSSRQSRGAHPGSNGVGVRGSQ